MRPTLHDRISLWILTAARFRRQKLDARDEGIRPGYYDRFFEEKDFEAYTLDPRMVVRRQTIADFLAVHAQPGANILDVGCGLGDVLSGLADGFRLHGVEYSAGNAQAAQRRLGERAVIQQGNIYDLPAGSGSMDVCLCLEVLEHIEDDARAVAEIHRVLRPGGLLIAAVPYTYYWPQYLRLLGHYRHYDRESFVKLLETGGFTVERFLPNHPRWHQAFTWRYVWVRAASLLLARITRESSVYRFRLPGCRNPTLQTQERRLQPLLQLDAGLDYATRSTSTFVVAQKEPP